MFHDPAGGVDLEAERDGSSPIEVSSPRKASGARRPDDPIEPRLDFDAMLAIAQAKGVSRHWPPVAGISYSPSVGVYTAQFSNTTAERMATGLPPPRLYLRRA